MASNQSLGLSTATAPNNLPLHLLRHGSALIAFGLLFGFTIPLTTYPRLALTAHIQFVLEGIMVVAAGLLLQSNPFARAAFTSGKTIELPRPVTLADRLGEWQRCLIYWGCLGIWATLLVEAANAWWGTEWVLALAHEAAGLKGTQPAERWMEIVVSATHMPLSAVLATMWPMILYALF